MARGWESKSVEEQQTQAVSDREAPKSRLSPEQRLLQHERQGLTLSRQRILQQIAVAQNPIHRKMLEQALAELDARLAQLG